MTLANEDGVEAGVGPAGMPIVEDAVLGVMVGPEVALLGFAAPGFKVVDGSLVYFEVVAQAEPLGLFFIEATKESCEVIVPGAHEVAGEDDSVGGFESPFLPVEGLVAAELFGEQKSAQ